MADRRRVLAPADSDAPLAAEEPPAGSNSSRWRRDRQCRQCMKPGCERHYVRCKHKHCCSLCSFGRHTERCDEDWQLFQERQQRARNRTRITLCAAGCGLYAGVGHVRCCALCVRSQGREHTEQCQARQQYAHVVGGPSPSTTGEDLVAPSARIGAAVDVSAAATTTGSGRAFRFAFGERPDRSSASHQMPGPEDVEIIDVEMMDAATGIGSAATSSAATSSMSPMTTEQHRMLLASITMAHHLVESMEPIEVLDSDEEAAEDMLNQLD